MEFVCSPSNLDEREAGKNSKAFFQTANIHMHLIVIYFILGALPGHSLFICAWDHHHHHNALFYPSG